MKKILVAMALAIAALPCGSAFAHHSFAMFDQTKIVTLKGTVGEFQWTNPHAWIELEVPGANGTSRRWGIELNSPNNLTRQGWTRKAIKPGDKVTVRVSPLRDGKAGGLFLDIVLPNGKVLDSGLPKDGRPINTPTL